MLTGMHRTNIGHPTCSDTLFSNQHNTIMNNNDIDVIYGANTEKINKA